MTSPSENYSDDHSLPPGTVLQGRYRILRQLGRGGMGAVYEAEDQRLGITVALKETLSTESGRRKQFQHEARLLAGMQHPALPRVSDHFVEGYRAFLVMQFIGGVDLARIIAQQPGPFPRDCVIAWADQLLDALIYLHSRDRQVIHRDIKPHNLKLTATGQIALLDFGLAKAEAADSSVTTSRAFFGYTKHYAPLEQIQDQHTDPRSDIYALGATLYHLLTGTKPPDAVVRATALVNGERDPLKSANEIQATVGSQIAAILDKAMAQKAEDRYASAAEFREALRRMGRVDTFSGEERSNDEWPSVTPPRRVAPQGQPVLSASSQFEQSTIEMALIGSAKRFGHGAITAVLVLVITLAAALWYGAQNLFDGSNAAAATTRSLNDTHVPSPTPRRSERMRVPEGGTASAKRRESGNEVAAQISEKKTDASARSQVRSSSPTQTPSGVSRIRRRFSAPAIRFPSPELDETAAAVDTPKRVNER